MHELLRLARAFRCEPVDPRRAFIHRLRIGLVIATVILIVSLLE